MAALEPAALVMHESAALDLGWPVPLCYWLAWLAALVDAGVLGGPRDGARGRRG